MQVSGEKIAYMAEKLGHGNKLRYCTILFASLIVPMVWVKGVSGVFDMLLLSLVGAFMLRNIDPVFAKLLNSTGTTPGGVVPFILPLAMMSAFGFIFDGVFVLELVVSGAFPWELAVLVLSVASRGVVCYITLPLVRMMFDANYMPADMQARVDTGQLLQRRPDAVPMAEAASNQFTPFQGAGQALSSTPV